MAETVVAASSERSVDKNLPWNFSVNVIDVAFITLGISLVSRDTVLPVLVSTLTDSNLAIGLIAALHALAFAATCISFVGLALNREPPSDMVKQRVSTRHYFRQLPAVLRANANYRRFFISRTVALLGAMANGFFIIYGSQRFMLDGAAIGLLTAVLVASQAIMSLIWGVIGDRVGHKLVLASAAFVLSLAALNTLLAPSQAWLILSFILLGASSSGDAVSGLNIILEFAAPEDRPTYIGLTNTLLAPAIVIAPILGGWLATVAGFPTLLSVAAAIAAFGGALLALWVREPRQRPLSTRA